MATKNQRNFMRSLLLSRLDDLLWGDPVAMGKWVQRYIKRSTVNIFAENLFDDLFSGEDFMYRWRAINAFRPNNWLFHHLVQSITYPDREESAKFVGVVMLFVGRKTVEFAIGKAGLNSTALSKAYDNMWDVLEGLNEMGTRRKAD